MNIHPQPGPASRRIAAMLGVPMLAMLLYAGATGCGRSSSASASAPRSSASTAAFVDTTFGFRAVPPAGWATPPTSGYRVPGQILKVWQSPSASNIVAFVQTGTQPATATQLLTKSADGMKRAGCTLVEEKIVKVAGADAMSMGITGPGTGSALSPGGTTQTYQHWIAIPKGNRVLVLLLTSPSEARQEASTAFEAMLGSVALE